MTFKPKSILVTGGAGFIGSNFIHYYLEQYPEVQLVNFDLLTYAGDLNNLAGISNTSGYTFVEGDICNRPLIEKILRDHQIDCIIHFAAESHVDRSITGPDAFIQTNIVGTFTLLDAAKTFWLQEKKWDESNCRFHHISTDEVYGSLDKSAPAFSEETPYQPNSPYSASKASSDHLVRAYHHTYGLPTTISNCSNNYGPRQHQEKFIPTVINACLNEQMIPIYGDGSNIRDWLHVDDHCRAISAIVTKGQVGETYNVGGNNEQSNLAIAKTICQLFDEHFPQKNSHTHLIEYVIDRPGHDWRYAINGSKIEKSLGFKPEIDFTDGLTQLIKFAT